MKKFSSILLGLIFLFGAMKGFIFLFSTPSTGNTAQSVGWFIGVIILGYLGYRFIFLSAKEKREQAEGSDDENLASDETVCPHCEMVVTLDAKEIQEQEYRCPECNEEVHLGEAIHAETTKESAPAADTSPSADTSPRIEEPEFLGKDSNERGTYEVYKANDAESARIFLLKKDVKEKLYYIVVDTPEGSWGMDIEGLYLEALLPFQTEVNSFDCKGDASSMPSIFSLQMVAQKMNDNFVLNVSCGKCKYEWYDGVRYQNTTIVRCPRCSSRNSIDTSHINIHIC